MSYEPYSKAPARSGIAYFGESADQPTYKSNANFRIDNANSRLLVPNIVVGNGGTIGATSKTDSITFGSNGDTSFVRNVTIAGDLIINGTTTTVNSTTVTVQDPIIFMGSGAPNVDDNKDRGIAFNWYDTAARSGFFGFDDSTGRFTFIPKATITNEVVTGAVGDIEANLVGNASTATTLAASRNFSLTGEITANAISFNGGGDVALNAVLHQTAISSQSEITTVNDVGTDYLLIWDDTDDDLKKITRANFVTGLGTMSSFTVSGVGSTAQTITNADNLIFASGPAISFSTATADTVSGTLNAAVAGVGLSMTNQVLAVDISEFSIVAVASGDSFLTLDSDGATEQRTTVMNLGAYLAGTNVTAAADGKLSVTDATIEGVIFTTPNFVDTSRIDFTVTAGQSVTADLIANSVSETYLATSVAGVGLTGGNGTALTIDLNEYSSVAIASGDRLFTLDSDNATEQLTTISNLGSYLAGTGIVSDGAGVLSVNTDNSTLEVNADIVRIKDDGVTFAKMQNSAAAGLSVIGRSTNSAGDFAEISASATDGTVLRRSGTTLGFGTINVSGIADGSVTKAKLSTVITTMNAPGTAILTDNTDLYLLNAAGGNLSVTLPDTVASGSIIRFKRTDTTGNNCIIQGGTGQTIDGAAQIQLYYAYESVTLLFSPNTWWIV